jgi:dolichol-phosphate mannosyltransferase
MEKVLVVMPTYSEKAGIASIIKSVLKHLGFEILIVDDASPDGTAQVVKEVMKSQSRVWLIERSGKLGLGTAYIEGFRWGLERGYDYFIEMDADGSHNPDALPWFIEEIKKGYELMIGSRYMDGKISVVGWDFRRLLLSKFGNFYASRILGLRLSDLTSGFRCYGKRALLAVDLEGIRSNGYSFQIEMAYAVSAAGCRVGEMPIIFYERTSGSSKMSKAIVREAIFLPWRLRLRGIIASANHRKGVIAASGAHLPVRQAVQESRHDIPTPVPLRGGDGKKIPGKPE